MSNGEHEIRTPKGLRIGNRSVVDGKNMLQIKRGGCEDYISAESLVECIHGLPVKSIEFFTAENQRKEACRPLPCCLLQYAALNHRTIHRFIQIVGGQLLCQFQQSSVHAVCLG